MSVYGYVLYESESCVCLWLSDEPVLFCIICMNNCCICLHVWMAPGKISCKLTGSPSLNKVFELNWIEHVCISIDYIIKFDNLTITTKLFPGNECWIDGKKDIRSPIIFLWSLKMSSEIIIKHTGLTVRFVT